MDDRANTFLDAHVHAVPEGKKRIRDHGRPDEAALGLLRLRIDLFENRSVFLSRFDLQLHLLVRHAVLPEAEPVGIFGVGFVNSDFSNPDPVLLARPDAGCDAVPHVDHRVRAHSLFDLPAEQHVRMLVLSRLSFNHVTLAFVLADSRQKVLWRLDAVEWRLLNNEAAVYQALEIHEPGVAISGELVDFADSDDSEISSLRQNGNRSL